MSSHDVQDSPELIAAREKIKALLMHHMRVPSSHPITVQASTLTLTIILALALTLTLTLRKR